MLYLDKSEEFTRIAQVQHGLGIIFVAKDTKMDFFL